MTDKINIELEEWQVRTLRSYFGQNDETQVAHWAFKVFDEALKQQCDIPVVSGMLKHRSGVKGVFVKSFYPTGKPLTTVIETDKGYYCAPSNEFVDA